MGSLCIIDYHWNRICTLPGCSLGFLPLTSTTHDARRRRRFDAPLWLAAQRLAIGPLALSSSTPPFQLQPIPLAAEEPSDLARGLGFFYLQAQASLPVFCHSHSLLLFSTSPSRLSIFFEPSISSWRWGHIDLYPRPTMAPVLRLPSRSDRPR